MRIWAWWSAVGSLLAARFVLAAPGLEVLPASADESRSVVLVSGGAVASIAVDPADFPVVSLAANLVADDVQKVTGKRPVVTNRTDSAQMVVVGTLG
jgi:hypothetical protein